MRKNYTIVETIEETDSWGLYVASENGDSYFLEKFTDQNKAEQCLSIASTIYKFTEGLSIDNEFLNGCIYIIYKVNKIQGSLIKLFDELSFSKKQYIIMDTVNILQKIHKFGIIYNNLCLENCFLFNSQSVFLPSFYKSVLINNSIVNHTKVSEKVNPLYISPELTGKTNIPISIQSDFYALGVLMYTLFTGKYPFENEDISALFSMHLARKPDFPQNINAEVPDNLSQIIMKLMEKNPEHRYKSHQGIIYDLEHISSMDFQLGAKDFDLEFKISHKIYGRETEINNLRNVFEKVEKGSFQMVIISGYSGVGKSALIEEMNHFEGAKGIHFLRGKFQQYKSNIPYFAFVEAFQIYFDKLLLSNNLELEWFCSEFRKNIGDRGQVLTSLFPKLEFIVGKQAPITQFVGVEAENRFILTFLEFLKIIASKESPLFLFLDDLQWTDLVSLTILKAIIKEQIGYVFIGLAYRDNEVDMYHPFHFFMDDIKLINDNVQHIKLLDLIIQDITQLLVESRIDNPEKLAVIIHKKTGGNSFFVHQYIKRFVQNKFLDCVPGSNLWHADIEAISGMEASDNIVEFMQQSINYYYDDTTAVLKILGVLGHNVDYDILEMVLKKSKAELRQLLYMPFTNNLLTETATNIRFEHDKIQQACYQLNNKDDLPKIHYNIACIFIENNLCNTIDDLFGVVSHLNNGFVYVKNEKEKFFAIYLEAALKSKEISAYREFLEFVQRAMQLLYPSISEDLKFMCYCEYHVALHLNGKYDEADEFFEDKLLNYSDIYALKDNYVTKISQDSMLGKYEAATLFGLSILEKLDIHIYMSPDINTLTKQLHQLREQLINQGIEDIFDLVKRPKRKPEEMKFICELISAIIPGSFFFNPLISSLLIFETIRIALKNGVYSSMGYPFSVATVPFILVENNYVRGAEYAEFAMQISENDQRSLGNSKHLYILFCWHWIYPLKNNRSLEIAREAFHLLLKGGDIQMSGFIFFNTIPYLFERGETLEEVLVEVKKGLDYVEKTANFHARGPYTVFKQFVLSMMTENASVEQFEIDGFSENKYLEENKENAMGRCFLYIYKTQYLYMHKEYNKAFEYANKSREVLGSITGFIPIATHYFYGALCFCRKYRDDPQIANDLDNYIAQLKEWADQVPENWLQKYYLIMAEKNKYSEDKSQTINFYVKAISTAEENGFTQDVALARELFSDYWYERGSKELGNALLEMSCKSYEKWGAIRKIQFIKDRNPHLANLFRVKDNDLRNIIKAQNLLAQETHIDVLLRKMLHLLIEFTGAEKCYLIRREDELNIEAFSDIQGNERILEIMPLSSDLLSLDLINYAIRTQKNITPEELKTSVTDTYFINKQPKSTLVVPVINHSEIVGIIYLEHSKIAGVFTQDKQDTVQLLSSQIAISLSNARLYQNMEERVKQRTEELEATNKELQLKYFQLDNALTELTKFDTELRESNATKDKFFSIIAHDLKGPIGSIANIFELAEEGEISITDNILSSINKTIKNTYKLLEDLLLWARSQRKSLVSSPVDINVSDLINSTVGVYQLAAKEKNIELKSELDSDDLFIRADWSMTDTVLRNLVNNAIKFTPSFGTVKITEKQNNRNVRIIISDTGIGMDQSRLGNLFSIDNHDKTRPGTNMESGTGLGLVVCKELVELNGGEIGVASTLNKGSDFWIELPQIIKSETTKVDWLDFLSNQNVLYIEDNPVHVENCNAVLNKFDLTWDIATTGQEGLKKILQNNYTFIFLDIQLPDINGIEIAKILRKEKGRDLKIIALTSFTQQEIEKTEKDSLFDGYLQKPLEIKALEILILNLLQVI